MCEYFLRRLNVALAGLSVPPRPHPPADSALRLPAVTDLVNKRSHSVVTKATACQSGQVGLVGQTLTFDSCPKRRVELVTF